MIVAGTNADGRANTIKTLKMTAPEYLGIALLRGNGVVRNYAGKPNLCSEKLMQNQRRGVRHKGKASRRRPAQRSCISLQLQRIMFSVPSKHQNK